MDRLVLSHYCLLFGIFYSSSKKHKCCRNVADRPSRIIRCLYHALPNTTLLCNCLLIVPNRDREARWVTLSLSAIYQMTCYLTSHLSVYHVIAQLYLTCSHRPVFRLSSLPPGQMTMLEWIASKTITRHQSHRTQSKHSAL